MCRQEEDSRRQRLEERLARVIHIRLQQAENVRLKRFGFNR